jgi:hypothetical protein
LQRYQHVIRIGETVRVSQIGHALFFDKMPLAGQQPQDARDDLESPVQELDRPEQSDEANAILTASRKAARARVEPVYEG